MPLYLDAIHLKNIGCFETGVFEVGKSGQITTFSGRNASGKTTLLNTVRSVFCDGNKNDGDAILKAGEDSGYIKLVSGEVVVTKEYKRKPEGDVVSSYKIHDPTGNLRKVSDITGLFNGDAVCPLSLLSKKGKERVEILLRAVSIEDPSKALEAIGAPVPADGTPFVKLEKSAIAIEDTRRQIGQGRDQKRKAAEETETKIKPNIYPVDITALAADMTAKQADLAKRIKAIHDEADRKKAKVSSKLANAILLHSSEKKKSETEARESVEKINSEIAAINEEIAKLQAKIAVKNADISQIRNEWRVKTAEADQEFETGKKAEILSENTAIDTETAAAEAEANASTGQEIASIQERIKSAQSVNDLVASNETLRKLARTSKEEADELDAEYKAKTAILQAVRKMKADALKSLPIEGLDIVDGDIVINGIPFDSINEAEKISIVIKLARLMGTTLIIGDGMESLDSNGITELRRQIAGTDVQVILARVTDSGLAVEIA